MAKDASFDITTGVDLQEVDNAVNQAQKEIAQRYDFKGAKVELEFKRAEGLILFHADNDMRLRAMIDMVQGKLVKRHVSLKNVEFGDPTPAGGDTLRCEAKLKQTLDTETSKKIVAAIKEQKFKKVQASIQAEQVRVVAPDRDELQAVIQFVRSGDYGVELQFGNYR